MMSGVALGCRFIREKKAYLTRLLGGSGPVGVVTFARFYGLHVLLPRLYLYRPILP